MKVSHRLYLTVTPAILGVFLLAGLFYWGQYAHAIPAVVLGVGAAAVVASLILAWSNARFVARRIEQLADALPQSTVAGTPDELDRIAHGVDQLSSDYARLLATIADDTAARLEEIRLPLHILLENRFGDLNENQEEMLGAARAAAETADADLVSLRQIAKLDLGELPLRRDRLKPSELIDALRPMLVAAGESAGASIDIEIAPLVPAVIGDRARLQDALAALLGDAVRSSVSAAHTRLTVDRRGEMVLIELLGTEVVASSVRSAAATRIILAHGGSVDQTTQALTIRLPLQTLP